MSITANQLVAYNLMRLRKSAGLSQEQAAERLEPWLGTRWSKTVYSAAERSYQGKRIRQFTADELLAMSLAFGVPPVYFFLPPKADDRDGDEGVTGGGRSMSWHDLLVVMFTGDASAFFLPRLQELPAEEVDPSIINAQGVISWRADLIKRVEDLERRLHEERARNGHDQEDLAQPVVAAIVTSPLGVLVGRRNDGKPPWTFIAGEQDAVKDENPADTAIREVKEETGLRIVAGELIGERVHPKTGRTMIYVAAAPTHGTDVFVGDEDELAEVRWVSLAEADELLPGMFEPVREHLARELGRGGSECRRSRRLRPARARNVPVPTAVAPAA